MRMGRFTEERITPEQNIYAVAKFSRHFNCPPDRLGNAAFFNAIDMARPAGRLTPTRRAPRRAYR
jgi:hypothetical protein